MTYNSIKVRPGLTAIAAVLALTSTPLLAQEIDPLSEPVADTAPDPAPVSDPLAPEPSAEAPAAAEPAATEEAQSPSPAPVSTRRAPARARQASPKPARAETPAAAEVASETIAAPEAPVDPAAIPAAEPMLPPVAEPEAPSESLLADETVPIAGAAGLGVLALFGMGMAVRSRRRRHEELEHSQMNQAYLDEHPEAEVPHSPEPVFARSALPEAEVRTDVPRTRLPEGFDLSRFGPHVRAAYLGPTPDNPSLSLKYRLRRAAAMDQRARLEAEKRGPTPEAVVRPVPEKKPAWASNSESFMFRRAGAGMAGQESLRQD